MTQGSAILHLVLNIYFPPVKACKLEAVRQLKEKIEDLLNNDPFSELILSGEFNVDLLEMELSEEAITAQNTFWQIPDQISSGIYKKDRLGKLLMKDSKAMGL
ncbi:hypothetical protein NDU88_002034 [Pleurodeles waltl]|uniref:Endonuclease/exonuclease/phosphatase domain-containing protein n=1 Tax=Pleurodeles waltl TaxID=8319 RepID=A0AAV7TJH0_PLEWA|nr:hypothetical protein NDU88_002034 [Pleurodeles waltl]